VEHEAVRADLGEAVALLERHAPLLERLDERDGARRAAADEEPDAAQAGLCQRRRLQHHLEHGAHRGAAREPEGTWDVEEEKAPEKKPVQEKPVKKVRPSKRVPKVTKGEKLVKEIKRGGMSKAVLALIQDSPEGITLTELKGKTGLKDRQIWSITSNAKKMGKIKQAKRGVYVGA